MNKKTFRNAAITTMAASATVAAVVPAAVSADEVSFSDIDQSYTHYENIMKMAEQGVITGHQDGTFKPYNDIWRGQMAAMLTNALDLNVPADVEKVLEQYDDVDADSDYAEQIAAVTEAGIFIGSDGHFGEFDKITREQMATVLVEAYDLNKFDNGSNVELNRDNISDSHVDNVQTLANLGITVATDDYRAYENERRDQLATMLVKTQNVVEENTPSVEDISAVNPNTVTVSGLGLEELNEDNFNIEDNKVESYNVNENGDKATLTFENTFASGVEQALEVTQTINNEENTSEYNFTYDVSVENVEAITKQVDSESSDQNLEFSVDGVKVSTSYLEDAGFDVVFNATKDVFGSEASDSTSGQLSQTDLNEDFEYEVVISKNGEEVAQSDLQKVSVVDYANTAKEFTNIDLNLGDDVVSENENNIITLNDNASLSNIEATMVNGTKEQKPENVEYSSSDIEVAMIDSEGNITPNSAGSVTFTIESGNAKKEINAEVTADERVASDAKASQDNVNLLTGQSTEVNVAVKDQFGDPVKGYDLSGTVKNSDDQTILTASNGSTDSKGEAAVKLSADDSNAGNGKLEITNNNDEVIGTVNVNIGSDRDVAERKLETSGDTELDLNPLEEEADSVDFNLNKYNADGVKIDGYDFNQEDSKYHVVSSDEEVAGVNVNGEDIHVNAESEGTATIQVKEGDIVRYETEVTVKDSTPSIKNASFQDDLKITDDGGTLDLEKDILDNVKLDDEGTIAYKVDNGNVDVALKVDGEDNKDLGEINVNSTVADNAKFDTIEGSEDIELTTDNGFSSDDNGEVILSFVKDGKTNPMDVSTVNVNIEDNSK